MAAVLLFGATAFSEEWTPLWKEWKAALKRYEQQREKSPNAKLKHPIKTFGPRLRAYAIEHAGYPRAAPALIELIRHTPDKEEQLWVMLQLRETHLRSKYLWRAVPALVRIPGEESLRTLREIAEGSPHARCASAARLGVHERTVLAIGKEAPNIRGKDKRGRVLSLRRFRGKPIVLAIGAVERDIRGIQVVGIGNDWPGWPKDEQLMRRFNAYDRPRLFVIDKDGVIRAKDPSDEQLAELRERLK